MLESVRKFEGKSVQAQVIQGMVVCGKCSSPTIHLDSKKGVPEEYCRTCHLSYIKK